LLKFSLLSSAGYDSSHATWTLCPKFEKCSRDKAVLLLSEQPKRIPSFWLVKTCWVFCYFLLLFYKYSIQPRKKLSLKSGNEKLQQFFFCLFLLHAEELNKMPQAYSPWDEKRERWMKPFVHVSWKQSGIWYDFRMTV